MKLTYLLPPYVAVVQGLDKSTVDRAMNGIQNVDDRIWSSSVMYGHRSARKQFTCGADYKFGGKKHKAVDVDRIDGLAEVMEYLSGQFKCDFSMAHMNIYPTAAAHLGWHADDEPVINPDVPIVGVSWGAPMRLIFRLKADHLKTYQLITSPGQVYVMMPGFQQVGEHRVARLTKKNLKNLNVANNDGVRISATFRGTIS